MKSAVYENNIIYSECASASKDYIYREEENKLWCTA